MSGLQIIAAPLAAGLLIVATHVPLGREVLNRGIVFIDLAIAQVATLGVIAAYHFGIGDHVIGLQAFAVMAALLAAWLMAWTETRWPDLQEAIIGSLYAISASAGLLLLAQDPRGGEHFTNLMAGQLLWTTWHQAGCLALIYLPLLILWFARARRYRTGFYLVFAAVITEAVQIAGVFLVFASLILPALGAIRWRPERQLAAGITAAVLSYACGLLLSLYLDIPAGPAIVCLLAIMAAGSALISRWQHPQ